MGRPGIFLFFVFYISFSISLDCGVHSRGEEMNLPSSILLISKNRLAGCLCYCIEVLREQEDNLLGYIL